MINSLRIRRQARAATAFAVALTVLAASGCRSGQASRSVRRVISAPASAMRAIGIGRAPQTSAVARPVYRPATPPAPAEPYSPKPTLYDPTPAAPLESEPGLDQPGFDQPALDNADFAPPGAVPVAPTTEKPAATPADADESSNPFMGDEPDEEAPPVPSDLKDDETEAFEMPARVPAVPTPPSDNPVVLPPPSKTDALPDPEARMSSPDGTGSDDQQEAVEGSPAKRPSEGGPERKPLKRSAAPVTAQPGESTGPARPVTRPAGPTLDGDGSAMRLRHFDSGSQKPPFRPDAAAPRRMVSAKVRPLPARRP